MRAWERRQPSGTAGPIRRSDTAGHRAEFTPGERRRIFQQMVITELEGGVLRYTRRRALQRYAEEIGIPAFDANLLIAEAQYRARQLDPIELDAGSDLLLPQTPPRSSFWPTGYHLAFALLAASIVDLILIGWIIR
jgi:hypothetical protein